MTAEAKTEPEVKTEPVADAKASVKTEVPAIPQELLEKLNKLLSAYEAMESKSTRQEKQIAKLKKQVQGEQEWDEKEQTLAARDAKILVREHGLPEEFVDDLAEVRNDEERAAKAAHYASLRPKAEVAGESHSIGKEIRELLMGASKGNDRGAGPSGGNTASVPGGLAAYKQALKDGSPLPSPKEIDALTAEYQR